MDRARLRRLAVRTALGIGVVAVAAVVVLLIALYLFVGSSCGCSKHLGPQVAFQYEVVEREGRPDGLNITHYGGDSASNERLYVAADVRFRAASGESATDDSLSWTELGDEGAEVTPGDSVLIELSGPERDLYAATFDVVWWGPDLDGELAGDGRPVGGSGRPAYPDARLHRRGFVSDPSGERHPDTVADRERITEYRSGLKTPVTRTSRTIRTRTPRRPASVTDLLP